MFLLNQLKKSELDFFGKNIQFYEIISTKTSHTDWYYLLIQERYFSFQFKKTELEICVKIYNFMR